LLLLSGRWIGLWGGVNLEMRREGEGRTGAACKGVDGVPDDEAADDACERCEGDGGGGLAEGDAAYEYDCFHSCAHISLVGGMDELFGRETFAEDGDEGDEEEGPFPGFGFAVDVWGFGVRWERRGGGRGRRTLSVEGVLELDAPFCFCSVHAKHGDAHDEDHDGCYELEYACVEGWRRLWG
jgi:hypothetical protein